MQSKFNQTEINAQADDEARELIAEAYEAVEPLEGAYLADEVIWQRLNKVLADAEPLLDRAEGLVTKNSREELHVEKLRRRIAAWKAIAKRWETAQNDKLYEDHGNREMIY